MNTENLSTLKIHKLTQAQYEREKEAGRIDENALYLTPDDSSEMFEGVVYAAEESVDASAETINADTLGGHPVSDFAMAHDVENLTAEDVGARPNTWLPTIAEIGAAPAGYGLGEYTRGAKSLAEVTASGFYQLAGSFLPNSAGWWGSANIVSPNYGDLTCVSIDGCKIHFNLVSGVWQPLEWENPPMFPGVEYRTTERWDGKAVYTMLVNCGALPTSGTTQVSCLPGWYKIIRCEGSTSDGWAFPVLTSSGNCFVSACGNSVYFQTTRDLGNQTADVQLWYVK